MKFSCYRRLLIIRTLGDQELIVRLEEYVENEIDEIDHLVHVYLEEEESALRQTSFHITDICRIFCMTKEGKELDRYEKSDLVNKMDLRKLNDYIRELKKEINNNPEMQQLLEDLPINNDIDFSKKPVIGADVTWKDAKIIISIAVIVAIVVIVYTNIKG